MGVRTLSSVAIATLVCAATEARAQNADEQRPGSNNAVYEATYFETFSPQTAFDIVARTPGFVLQSGDDVRGFGGAGGNVLIDGARPVSKSGGIEDALRRIPATQVERVELIRGAQTAEAQGQTVVLNIIRRSATAGGTWSVDIERNGSGLVYPRGEATYARQLGGWETSLRVNAMWEQFPYRTRRTNRDGAGALTSTWQDDRPTTYTEAFISGDATRAIAGGLLNLTGRFGWVRFYYDQDSDIFLSSGSGSEPDQFNLFEYDRDTWALEVGGDFTLNRGGWTWKIIGLARAEDYGQEQTDTRTAAGGALIGRSEVGLTQEPLELVARSTATHITQGRLRAELGGEIAYNRLGSAFAFSVDNGGGPTPIDLPAANVTVEELRSEAFANFALTLNDAFTFEAGLAAEFSEINVAGDVESSQRFTFVKPSAALVWRIDPSMQLRLGAARTVGQLDFTDFAASAELQDDQTFAGNPSLGPDQTTRLSLSGDYRGANGFALNAELFHEWRTDVLEQVLLASGAPGLANAGDARVWGVKGSLNAPLVFLLPGASLTLEAEFLGSAFDDPLTGLTRSLTGLQDTSVSVEFRQDFTLQRWTWGAEYEAGNTSTSYLIDQTDTFDASPQVSVFAETTRWLGVRTRLSVISAGTERYTRFRTFFDPDRSGAISGTDQRSSVRGAFVRLTMSKQF